MAARFGRRTAWHDFFWRWTHPREAYRQERAEKEAAYEARVEQRVHHAKETLLRLHQLQEEWRAVTDDPNATGDGLRRIITEETKAWEQAGCAAGCVNESAFGRIEDIFSSVGRRHEDFLFAVSAHPNLPPEVFGRELAVTASSVTGLLRNPICPLLPLERPDFIEALDLNSQFWFARLALQHTTVPCALLSALASVCDPWLALEARTHIAAELPDVPTVAHMEWLDTQVVKLLQGDRLHRRCLVYELACHGLLAPTIEPEIPWQQPEYSDASALNGAATHPAVMKFVQETRKIARWKPAQREWQLHCWLNQLFPFDYLTCTEALRLEAALFHPGIAPWVGEYIAQGWPGNNHSINSLHRLLTRRQGKAMDAVTARHRDAAISEALEYWSGQHFLNSAGIFYCVMRDLPNPLKGADWNTSYHPNHGGGDLRMDVKNTLTHFLVRLAIVLRLDDADAEQKELREMLLDDPNRYVRAAARKEIVWPGSAGLFVF